MSYNRRRSLVGDRYNRLLYLAGMDPTTFGYYRDVQNEFGKFIDPDLKKEYLSAVSVIANLQLLTEHLRKKEGVVVGATLALVVGTPVTIDFLDPSNNRNFPTASRLAPRRSVYEVHITNQGAGNLEHSLNTSAEGSVLLLANAPTKIYREDTPTWEAINLQATGANCTVNVAIVY